MRYLLEGMAMLEYDAINLAEKDLQYGREFLRNLQEEHDLPFVSANVYDRATNELFAPAFLIKHVNGKKVGIFGVTLAQGVQRLVDPDVFEVRDPLAAAEQVVQTLEQECDVIVALAHLGLKGALELAEKVPGIDIVISGHHGTHVRQPHRIGNTVIMQPGSKGKYLGLIEFALQNGQVQNLTGKTVALNDRIPDDPRLAELVRRYDDEVLLAFPLESPKAKTRFSLASERACRRCHPSEHQQWRSTLHSHAWETLVQKKQAHNPECQTCHTTLFGQPNGFVTLKENPDMVNVQCLACHRPKSPDLTVHSNRLRRGGSANGNTTGTVKDFLEITKETCVTCHNEDNSPHFDYESFLAKVKH